MSRRDTRRALSVRLPEDLRKRLVGTAPAFLPLSYLTRQILRRALNDGITWSETMAPGTARPILLQLSADEQAQLQAVAKAKEVSEEIAVLSLIATLI